MKIIDILKQSAELLGLKTEVAILSQTIATNEQESLANENIFSLFNLVKLAIQQLCTNYVPLVDEQSFTTENNKYPLSDLTNYVKLKEVTRDGLKVAHKVVNRQIVMDEDGSYTAVYFTYPTVLSMFDDVEYLKNLSADVIVFGLCAYFSISRGLFDEFTGFYNKYIELAENIKDLKIFSMPQRRWE